MPLPSNILYSCCKWSSPSSFRLISWLLSYNDVDLDDDDDDDDDVNGDDISNGDNRTDDNDLILIGLM